MHEETAYTAPMIVEVGDLAEVTLGFGGGGFDAFYECLYFCGR